MALFGNEMHFFSKTRSYMVVMDHLKTITISFSNTKFVPFDSWDAVWYWKACVSYRVNSYFKYFLVQFDCNFRIQNLNNLKQWPAVSTRFGYTKLSKSIFSWLSYNKYRTRAILGRSWLEAALEYKPYIRPKVTVHKWSLEMG